jgi:hypothetical protein
MRELDGLVMAGPDPKIHKVVRWRCVDLRAEVAKRFVARLCDEDAVARSRPGRCAPTTAMPYGHPGPLLRATAWASAGRDGRMAVLIEQQDWRSVVHLRRGQGARLLIAQKAVSFGPASSSGYCCCSRHQLLHLAAVTDPDFLPQFVKHFPNGKRLLGRPGDGDFNRDRTQMIGHCAHGLAPRRLRARASARSRASLSR